MEVTSQIPGTQPPETQPEYAGTLDYLPVFMELKGQRCLVVGGGDAAARKTGLLLKAGAQVTVAAATLDATLDAWTRDGRIQWRQGDPTPADLRGAALVFAATEDAEHNRQVSEAAKAQRIPVNVVDHPEWSTFIMPAIVERSPVLVAVASGGASPVLSRLVRARLERALPRALGSLAHLAGRFTDRVKSAFATIPARTAFWESMLDGPAGDLALSGQMHAAESLFERALSGGGAPKGPGCVYLVGAGPGDPDLLTLRAVRLLERADAIVYDRLANPEILEYARRDAEMHYVGKAADRHTLPQEEINALLVRLGREGKQVVRLKGGDPYVFGRGGEEAEDLSAAGVAFQVVPGITAATGCAASTGIPLTHRDCSQTLVLITGHLKDNTMDLNWKALAQPGQTLVCYMGLGGLEIFCRELQAHGLPASTPAACIEKGTTAKQRLMTGTLTTLPAKVRAAEFTTPTLILVGEVVAHRREPALREYWQTLDAAMNG